MKRLMKTLIILTVVIGVSLDVFAQQDINNIKDSQKSMVRNLQQFNRKLDTFHNEEMVLMLKDSQLKTMLDEHIKSLSKQVPIEMNKDMELNLTLEMYQQSLESLSKEITSQIDQSKQIGDQIKRMMIGTGLAKHAPGAPVTAPAKN